VYAVAGLSIVDSEVHTYRKPPKRSARVVSLSCATPVTGALATAGKHAAASPKPLTHDSSALTEERGAGAG
jgi:hypothetical protein